MWFFELQLPSYQLETVRPLSSDINETFSPRELKLTEYLIVFGLSVNPTNGCVSEIRFELQLVILIMSTHLNALSCCPVID